MNILKTTIKKSNENPHSNTSSLLDVYASGAFLGYLLSVALGYLLLRIGSTFMAAMALEEQWHIRIAYGFLPVVSFSTNEETYTIINTISTIATTILLLLTSLYLSYLFVKQFNKDKQNEFDKINEEDSVKILATMHKMNAWLLATVMIIPQLIVAYFVNRLFEIELALSYAPMMIIAGIIALTLIIALRKQSVLAFMALSRVENLDK